MRKGQFGSLLVDIIFWLAVIGLLVWILRLYLTGAVDEIVAPGEALLGT